MILPQELSQIEERLNSQRIGFFQNFVGETVKLTIESQLSDSVLFCFESGRWAFLGVTIYPDSDTYFSLSKEFYPLDSLADFVHLGLATADELQSYEAYTQTLRDEWTKKRELDTLAMLKAKYEGSCHQ